MGNVDWRGYRILAWTLLVGLAGLAVYAAVSQGWQNGLILGAFAVGAAIYLALQRSAPSAFNALFAAAIAVNAAGWSWGLFQGVWGYDEVAHALGTLGATLVVGWYGYHAIQTALRLHPATMALAILALGVALGALWEVLEWAGYWLFTRPPIQSLDDKISDLVADSAGALIAAALFRWGLLQRAPDRVEENAGSRAPLGGAIRGAQRPT